MTAKRDFYQVHDIHPATPRRLVTALHKVGWNERALARARGVNILYVSQLIRHGIEPTDRTVKGQEARVKLSLPRLKPKPKLPPQPKPAPLTSEWWDGLRKNAVRAMTRQTRKRVLVVRKR